ncbi:IclR family transcriptional regulator [Paralcaligenes ginsengisoli]
MSSTMKQSGPKTFARGLRIMDALHSAGDTGLKITDIAIQTGIERTTVYRFLDILIREGYAHASPDKRVFVFNEMRFTRGTSLAYTTERLKPVLQRISAQTGDSSFLVRREDGDSLCVHRELGTYPLQVLSVTIGHRQPLGVGAAGLTLLANLPQNDIDDILDINKEKLANYGGMTSKQLRKLIASTLERGWSAVGNAAVPGVLGVGVPILRNPDNPLFAISVSSVVDRMPLKRQHFIINVIKKELAAAHFQSTSNES